MKPSLAFEVTVEDLTTVLIAHGYHLGEPATLALFNLHIVPHYGAGGRIERAALTGENMTIQTMHAYAEMAAIMREAGVIIN